jgi:hypothetical protein
MVLNPPPPRAPAGCPGGKGRRADGGGLEGAWAAAARAVSLGATLTAAATSGQAPFADLLWMGGVGTHSQEKVSVIVRRLVI